MRAYDPKDGISETLILGSLRLKVPPYREAGCEARQYRSHSFRNIGNR